MYDISENKRNGIFTEIRLNSRLKKLFNFKMEGNYYALVIARAIIAYVILITGIGISVISLFILYGGGWIFLYVCFAIYFIEYLIWFTFIVIVSIILMIIPMVSRGKEV